ncbi:MAG: hypothetical protein RL531_598 [Actinomycetota bacterium]
MHGPATRSEYLALRDAVVRAGRRAERRIRFGSPDGAYYATETRLLRALHEGAVVSRREREESEDVLAGLFGGLLWVALAGAGVPWPWVPECFQEAMAALFAQFASGVFVESSDARRAVRHLAFAVWTEVAIGPWGPLADECA